MIKRLYILFLLIGSTVMAQDPGMINHYTVFPVVINPASTGFDQNHTLFFNHQSRWAGFGQGSPKSYMANYNGAVGNNLGLGANIAVESIGAFQNFTGGLSYAYHFKLEDTRLSIGLSTQLKNRSLASRALTDPTINHNDPFIIEQADGVLRLDASLGFFAMFKEKFFVGGALPGMIGTRIDQSLTDISYEDKNLRFNNYFVNFGAVLPLENADMVLTPSIAIRKMNESPVGIDFNLISSFMNERLIGGFSYRVGGGSALGLMIGVGFDKFNIYYGYDVSFLGFQEYSNGTHEVTLSYRFGNKKNGTTAPTQKDFKTKVYKSIDEN